MAIGIVLARPDKKRVQPSTFRFSRLNFPASNKPAPNPIAPRVAAINAISGRVTLLGSEIFIVFFSTPLDSLGESMRHCRSRRCRFGHLLHDMSGHVLAGMKSLQHAGSDVMMSLTFISILPSASERRAVATQSMRNCVDDPIATAPGSDTSSA